MQIVRGLCICLIPAHSYDLTSLGVFGVPGFPVDRGDESVISTVADSKKDEKGQIVRMCSL